MENKAIFSTIWLYFLYFMMEEKYTMECINLEQERVFQAFVSKCKDTLEFKPSNESAPLIFHSLFFGIGQYIHDTKNFKFTIGNEQVLIVANENAFKPGEIFTYPCYKYTMYIRPVKKDPKSKQGNSTLDVLASYMVKFSTNKYFFTWSKTKNGLIVKMALSSLKQRLKEFDGHLVIETYPGSFSVFSTRVNKSEEQTTN